MVQRRATSFVMSDYHPTYSVSQMLSYLQWKSLSERRAHNKIIMLFRIIHELLQFHQPHRISFQLVTPPGATLSGSDNSIVEPNPIYQYPFFSSAICLWNTLPDSVVSAPNVGILQKQTETTVSQLGAYH